MAWTEAFAPAEARYRDYVMSATWGHLAPEPGRAYKGYILFAYSAYGDITPVQTEFEGLDDSPWFFDDMNEYIGDLCLHNVEQGGVYRFTGTYKKFKNGGCRFSGKVEQLNLMSAAWTKVDKGKAGKR